MKKNNHQRRDFIKKSALAAGAGLLAPRFTFGITHSNKHMKEIVGHGNFKYSVDKEWGVQDPSKTPVNDCHEMVLDSKGRILMTTTGENNNNIIIYDQSGKVLDSWGTEFPGAHGLSIAGEGSDQFLFITDPDTHKVWKTTLDGQIIMTLERPKEVAGYTSDDQFKPTETAILPNGDFYVADGYGQNYIIHYNAKGEYLGHFGGSGDEDDQFNCCHGITLDTRDEANPTLLITSRANQRFKRFSLDGKHMETIQLPGCSVCRPVIHGENIYFAVIVTETWDNWDGMLAILDKENQVVSLPGGSAPEYRKGSLVAPVYDGKTFRNPHDVLVDDDGNLYVPQWASGKTYPIKLNRI
ncbi:twin-arginine translocation signal domain-containing protein [Flavobacteriaceae bacterium TP-CH-4]|uniref:Twin-arginine translocation signal domain-containing protein n=1 Tax=Pelagihabitans pacificus TaxID=2696054 RepID=A0A967B0Q7_9FLAO|nr:twin-arginine translocation signal domain-containing protein [Pelagihabitans pacificus]NHF60987.1 twin-arginine translocation signal domain-containing protein [Pelagihabitans pacificus]